MNLTGNKDKKNQGIHPLRIREWADSHTGKRKLVFYDMGKRNPEPETKR